MVNKDRFIVVGAAVALLLIAIIVLRVQSKNVGGASTGETVIVAPANPDDPRFKPSPQLSGGAGARN